MSAARSSTDAGSRSGHRRGSVILLVIWAVAIAAVLVGAAQVLAYRQATMGRESVAKVEARWAARAGIEETLAVLEYTSCLFDKSATFFRGSHQNSIELALSHDYVHFAADT